MRVENCGGLIFIVDKDGKERIFNKKYIHRVTPIGETRIDITLCGSDTDFVQEEFNIPILDFWNKLIWH